MKKRWLLLAFTAWPTLSNAKTPGWSFSEASGSVTVLHTGVSKIATRGNAVVPGDIVRTGADARAVLVRGQEYMMVAPQSQIRVPDDAAKGAITQMVEEAGSVIFMIKKMATPHFAVQTPYLAAVVKGTTFSVSVDAAGATVHVLEGAVDVSTLDGGAHQMVLPGGSANVGAGSMDAMQTMIAGRAVTIRSRGGNGPPPQTRPAPRLEVSKAVFFDPSESVASTVVEAPVSLTAATGGLVNDAPTLTLADASTSLKELATTQSTARQAQVSLTQAIVQQQTADAAAAAKADAEAKAVAAANSAKVFAEQAAQAAAAQASADAAAKQAADQAAAQAAAALAAQQAQAAQAAAAASAQQAAQATTAASSDQAQQAAALAQQAANDAAAKAAAAAAAKQAADAAAAAQAAADRNAAQQAAAQSAAAAKLAADQAAAQQAAAAAAAAQAQASAATKATPIGPGLNGVAGIIGVIVGDIDGKHKDGPGPVPPPIQNGNNGINGNNGNGTGKH